MLFEPNKQEVAECIQNICKKLKKSPEEFAEFLGVKLATVEKWLKGNGVPSRSNLKKMGNLVNLTPDEILYVSVDKFISDNIDLINDVYGFNFTKQEIAQIIEEEYIEFNDLRRLEFILDRYKFDMFLNLGERKYSQFYKEPKHYKNRSLSDVYYSIDDFIYENHDSINDYFELNFTENELIELVRRENITLDNAVKLFDILNGIQEQYEEYVQRSAALSFYILGIMETLMKGSNYVIYTANKAEREKFREALLGALNKYNFFGDGIEVFEFFDKVYKDDLSKIVDKYNQDNILDIKRFK